LLRIVVNEASGPEDGRDLGALAERGEVVDVADLDGLAGDTTVLGVCGGDGTVSAAAAIAMDRGIPLLVIPGGTLNHFAHDLGIEDLDDALAAYSAPPVRVDVGEIDGRPFLNNASLGAYPDLVDARERWEDRIGKRLATALAVYLVLRHGEPYVLEVDGVRRRVWLAWFGNCRYEVAGLIGAGRPALDDGVLDIRIVHADRRWARLRLLASAMLRRPDACAALESRRAETVSVRALDTRVPRLAADGETFDGAAAFTVGKRRGALLTYRAGPARP
jgi:diacylglycerol kinase family enzyme